MVNASSDGTGPKKDSARADTRSLILDAALHIITTRGIDAVRLEEITATVGITKGSLYWHFENREDLIRQCLAEHLRRLNEEIVEGVNEALDVAESSLDYLMLIAPYVVDPFDAQQTELRWQKLEYMVATRRDPELANMMHDVQVRSLRAFVEITRRASERGLLRAGIDPVALAVAMMALGLGATVLIDVLGEDGPTPEAWNGLVTYLISQTFPDAVA
jgi:TetR/AcrR family acrAB operon transcriptional repressor